jgi:hypothetical protein
MEEEIKDFFGNTWNQTEVDEHVLEKIKDARHVIDVGCGFNAYKKFTDNLIGVDIVNERADWIGDIIDYPNNTDQYDTAYGFDVAICYGILHFNSYDWIRKRLEWVIEHTAPDAQILMKVNPSKKEDQAEELRSSDVIWFDKWNRGLADHFADIYKLEVWNWREWRNPLDNSKRLKFDYRKRR